MIRTSKIVDYNPKGFIFILSPAWPAKTKKGEFFFRASYLATYIDTEKTWPVLFDNIYSNVIYNGMYYYDLPSLHIINLWKTEVPDLERKHLFQSMIIHSKFNNKDFERKLKITNLNYGEFLFSGLPHALLNIIEDKSVDTDVLFFIDSENWSDVVKGFLYSNIRISGVSTNQRHIFNPLHNRMSMYLNILLGRVWASKLSHFDFKNPNINHRPNYDIFGKSKTFSKVFWNLISKNKINDFITITKIIIESNQLATIHDEFKVIDFFRFWFYIIKLEFWRDLYFNINNKILENKNVITILKELYNLEMFKVINFKINLSIIEQCSNKDYNKINPTLHKYSLLDEILYLKDLNAPHKNIYNENAIESINNSYVNYNSSNCNLPIVLTKDSEESRTTSEISNKAVLQKAKHNVNILNTLEEKETKEFFNEMKSEMKNKENNLNNKIINAPLPYPQSPKGSFSPAPQGGGGPSSEGAGVNKPKNRGFSTLNKTKLYQILPGNDKCCSLPCFAGIGAALVRNNLAGGNNYLLKLEESSNKGKDKYTFTLDKESTQNVLRGIRETAAPTLERVASDAGIAAASATLGSTVVKATAGAPPMVRAMAGVGTATTSYLGMKTVQLGTDFVRKGVEGRQAKDITINVNVNKNNDNSPPSPGEDFIHSPLENFDWNFLSVDNVSILEGLLKVVLNSNIIILFSVILNLIALFYRYILPYVLNFLFNITDKFILNDIIKSRIKSFLNINNKINKYFWLIIISINSLIIISLILLNIYISNELTNNIDWYIQEYKNFHDNKSMLIPLICNSKAFGSKNNVFNLSRNYSNSNSNSNSNSSNLNTVEVTKNKII